MNRAIFFSSRIFVLFKTAAVGLAGTTALMVAMIVTATSIAATALMIAMMVTATDAHAAVAKSCPNNGDARTCMVCACYHEAKGESFEGKVAVAQVVLERVKSPLYPNNECAVVYQRSQFSWSKNSNRSMREGAPLTECGRAVDEAYRRGPNGLISFHNGSVSPGWKLARCTKIDHHIFYARTRSQCPRAGASAGSARSGSGSSGSGSGAQKSAPAKGSSR